jgi:hypothetical protein
MMKIILIACVLVSNRTKAFVLPRQKLATRTDLNRVSEEASLTPSLTSSSSVCKSTSTKLYQRPSLPSWDELSQQKSEALKSMSEFHDGLWLCENGAISSDVSGGSILRSPPFQTSISARLGLASDNGEAFKLVENISWEQKGSSDDNGLTLFGRSCNLGGLADIDSVDGSYSLHSFTKQIGENERNAISCALPQSISGVDPSRVTSVIESCLVATETERVRCLMLYGKNTMSTNNDNDNDSVKDDDMLQEQRLLRVVISYERKQLNDNSNLNDIIQETVGNSGNRLNQMASAMSGVTEDLGQNVKYPIGMMSLSMGPWLGDTIIRDKSFNSLLPKSKQDNSISKGFGAPRKKETPPQTINHESGFGEWVMGIQKTAMTFKYDFDCNCRQIFDYGKSMGVYVEGWPIHSSGIIYDDRMSRRIKPEDRSMYIDFDNGAYCGFTFGSVFVKAPRFLTSQRQGSALPMLTEFALFQKPEADDDEKDSDGHDGICCSRISRLYNDDGSLKQGCTSFFVLKPIVDESDVDNTSLLRN